MRRANSAPYGNPEPSDNMEQPQQNSEFWVQLGAAGRTTDSMLLRTL